MALTRSLQHASPPVGPGTGRRWFSTGISAGVMPKAGAAASAAGSMVPFCLPPETKPVIAGAAGGGGGGGAPMEGKTLAAAGDGGATPDKMSLAACGKTPGTNCGVDIPLAGVRGARQTDRHLTRRRTRTTRAGDAAQHSHTAAVWGDRRATFSRNTKMTNHLTGGPPVPLLGSSPSTEPSGPRGPAWGNAAHTWWKHSIASFLA